MESRAFDEGGQGAIELAEALISAAEGDDPQVSYLYPVEAPIEEKVSVLARNVYGADGVHWDRMARNRLKAFQGLGWGDLPVCMTKAHLSLSHNPTLKGRPRGYTFEISDVRASIGAGFIYPIAGNVVTMPGLPRSPRQLDVDDGGNILGM